MDKRVKRTAAIVFAISLYWVTSILMIFLNKYLLDSKELKFDAPIFVTWFQCVFSVITYLVMLNIKHAHPERLKFFDTFDINLSTLTKVVPVSSIFVSMIIFNNLSLKHIPVSFYMIVKSLATFFNVVLVYLYFGERTSPRALCGCSTIIMGFLLGIKTENQLNGFLDIGIIFGVSSSLFSALFGVYIKKTIQIFNKNLWKLNFYTNFFATFALPPMIFLMKEHERIALFPDLYTARFWFFMLLSGFLAFFIGYATSLQIQFTSPLTHNISGTAKSCAQTVLGVIYYNETKTGKWWLSNLFILVGATYYSLVRNQEMNQPKSDAQNKSSTPELA